MRVEVASTDSDLHPVMILAGGTGGHIFPGLAVAHALKARGEALAGEAVQLERRPDRLGRDADID